MPCFYYGCKNECGHDNDPTPYDNWHNKWVSNIGIVHPDAPPPPPLAPAKPSKKKKSMKVTKAQIEKAKKLLADVKKEEDKAKKEKAKQKQVVKKAELDAKYIPELTITLVIDEESLLTTKQNYHFPPFLVDAIEKNETLQFHKAILQAYNGYSEIWLTINNRNYYCKKIPVQLKMLIDKYEDIGSMRSAVLFMESIKKIPLEFEIKFIRDPSDFDDEEDKEDYD